MYYFIPDKNEDQKYFHPGSPAMLHPIAIGFEMYPKQPNKLFFNHH
jgi:hypothetical protein